MPYTSSNTAWSNNHRPTADDLNRIEANAEAGAMPLHGVYYYGGPNVAINTAGVFSTPTVSHATRTGRVKITVVIGIINSSGSTKTVAAIAALNGATLVGNEVAHQVNNGDYATLSFSYVHTGLTIGATVNFGFRIRATTAGGPTMYQWYTLVEDI